MLKKIVNSYTRLLDEKLENGTMVILIIVILIISISFIISDKNPLIYTKSNILEFNKNIINEDNIIKINWVNYKIILEEFIK